MKLRYCLLLSLMRPPARTKLLLLNPLRSRLQRTFPLRRALRPQQSVAPAANTLPGATVENAYRISPAGSSRIVPVPTDLAAPPADAKKTASGLATKVLQPGKGKSVQSQMDKVLVNYSGWTKDGKIVRQLDSTSCSFLVRCIPSNSGLDRRAAIDGRWRKAKDVIPAKLAYGDHPMAGAPVGDLVFDVEAPRGSKAAQGLPQSEGGAKKRDEDQERLSYRYSKKGTGADHLAAQPVG